MTREQIVELKEIESQIKALESKANAIKDAMKKEMGADELKEVDGFKVHYTVVITTKLDGKKLKAELPDLWNKYSKEDITRRFSIT